MKIMKLMPLMCVVVVTLTLAPKAYAINRVQVTEEKRINQQEIIEERKEVREQIREEMKDKVASRVGAIKAFFGARVFLNNAKVTGKGDNSLTVEKDSKTYTITIDSKTRLRRRFFGDTTLDEILVGHTVSVSGKYTDEARTTILAVLIRDLSIQKRFGAFVGDVTAINGNDITINSVHRGSQKATVSSATKFVNRKMGTIALGDIAVGHKIRVKGMWDSEFNTVTEIREVKDFSLPVRVTPTANASPAVSATP